MKKCALLPMGLICVLFWGLTGCITAGEGGMFSGFSGTTTTVTGGGSAGVSSEAGLAVSAPVYTGPKIRVAVQQFTNKGGESMTVGTHGGETVITSDPIGTGMTEQLVTALMQAGCFEVIERQSIDDLQREQVLTGQDPIQLARPDYFIYGAVTEFMASQSNVGLGGAFNSLGGFGSAGGGWLSIGAQALSAMSKQDHVAIDIRVIDTRTGVTVFSASVEGKAKDFGAALGGMFGSTLIGVSGEYRTPTAKAVRACMIKAVNLIGGELTKRQETIRQTASTQ